MRQATMKTALVLCAVLLTVAALPACNREEQQREDQRVAIAAKAAVAEQAAKEGAAAFDDAVSKENWALAKAQGEVLLAEYPDSEATKRVAAQLDEVKAKADAGREGMRTAALWSYNTETVEGGKQLSAAIYAKDDVDTDGSGPNQVRLIFRDHPSWGRSAYLVLQAGDFRCPGGCKVQVKVDDAAPKAMAATRPKTDEAIAMFIEDERALWRITKDAKLIAIEFPTRDMGKRTAVFEVVGLDRTKLPGWN